MDKQSFVYILASQKNGTLYTGVTSDLIKRMHQHKTRAHPDSFTSKYGVQMLVWYLAGQDITEAIALEKKIKNRNRAWKIALIERTNPDWQDLSMGFFGSQPCAQPSPSSCAEPPSPSSCTEPPSPSSCAKSQDPVPTNRLITSTNRPCDYAQGDGVRSKT